MDISGGRVEELTELYDKSYKKFDKMLNSAPVGQRATADQIRNIEYALGPHAPTPFSGPTPPHPLQKKGSPNPKIPDIKPSKVRALLRGALKFALPLEVAYEGYRLSKEAEEHGLATGTKKHLGTMVKEAGGIGELLGANPAWPDPATRWGMRKIGGALSSAGDWIRGDEEPEMMETPSPELSPALSSAALSATSAAAGSLMGTPFSVDAPLNISAERFETLMDSDSPQPSVKKKSDRWPYDR
jgi:hypothetical protein